MKTCAVRINLLIFYNQAISQLGWAEPTLIQETAIPLLLEGKDVLMRARTGSGKTAAFTVPVIQKILNLKNISTHQSIRALILSPSKELCGQVSTSKECVILTFINIFCHLAPYNNIETIIVSLFNF